MGHLIAFEGLDQSGKQTQAEFLRDRLKEEGWKARLVSFPDYGTTIGEEIARALQGEREYGADVMQLLYIANRYERNPTFNAGSTAGCAGVRSVRRVEHRLRRGSGSTGWLMKR
jgi:dTMP kinase